MPTTLTYDEQIQQLKDICDKKMNQYKFYADEVEAQTEKGCDIHQDLKDKLALAEKEMHESLYNYNSLLAYCSKNKIDLPIHWKKLGF